MKMESNINDATTGMIICSNKVISTSNVCIWTSRQKKKEQIFIGAWAVMECEVQFWVVWWYRLEVGPVYRNSVRT